MEVGPAEGQALESVSSGFLDRSASGPGLCPRREGALRARRAEHGDIRESCSLRRMVGTNWRLTHRAAGDRAPGGSDYSGLPRHVVYEVAVEESVFVELHRADDPVQGAAGGVIRWRSSLSAGTRRYVCEQSATT